MHEAEIVDENETLNRAFVHEDSMCLDRIDLDHTNGFSLTDALNKEEAAHRRSERPLPRRNAI